MIKDISNKYNHQLYNLERRITLARGEEMVDLIIKNAKIINVFSGEIYETDVAIADGIFIGFGNGYDTKIHLMLKEGICALGLSMVIFI